MLILASLLGMFAIGSMMFFEPSQVQTSEDDDPFADATVSEIDTVQLGDVSGDLFSFIDENGDTQVEPNETTGADDLLFGTNSADELFGDAGADNIMAGGGDDTVSGGADRDVLHGNGGDDDLSGDDGFDELFGDQGDDALFGGEGDDTLSGNGDDDHLNGGGGNDSLYGGEGEDTLWGGLADDTLNGSSGDDLLDGGEGNDLLNGGTGNDALNGWESDAQSAHFLDGGDGDDTIFAGAGDDVSGGFGADTVVLDSAAIGSAQIWDFEAGEDTLVLFYDGADGVPEINITQDNAGIGHWLVQSNGTTLVIVTGDAPTLSDISLVERT
jgi:Ca2+-binding RTX toxin-like protein